MTSAAVSEHRICRCSGRSSAVWALLALCLIAGAGEVKPEVHAAAGGRVERETLRETRQRVVSAGGLSAAKPGDMQVWPQQQTAAGDYAEPAEAK